MGTQMVRVLCFLLQHLTFHFKENAKAKLGIRDKTDIYNNSYCITRVLLGQVVLFIGYCARDNAKFQKCLSWAVDGENSLIAKLCLLPFDYFSKPPGNESALPDAHLLHIREPHKLPRTRSRAQCTAFDAFHSAHVPRKVQRKERTQKGDFERRGAADDVVRTRTAISAETMARSHWILQRNVRYSIFILLIT